jgi:hypothetical protein
VATPTASSPSRSAAHSHPHQEATHTQPRDHSRPHPETIQETLHTNAARRKAITRQGPRRRLSQGIISNLGAAFAVVSNQDVDGLLVRHTMACRLITVAARVLDGIELQLGCGE